MLYGKTRAQVPTASSIECMEFIVDLWYIPVIKFKKKSKKNFVTVITVSIIIIIISIFQGSYDTELQALHELIQRKVVTLLSDPENIVKQTLLENGITQLCVFFGRQKANDVLLSHMITFLNDKQDWQLRGAFFDSIVGVAAYVGWHSLVMLRPLLEQVI